MYIEAKMNEVDQYDICVVKRENNIYLFIEKINEINIKRNVVLFIVCLSSINDNNISNGVISSLRCQEKGERAQA